MCPELISLLEAVGTQSAGTDALKYHVKPILGLDRHYFGRTSSGAPCLLMSAETETFRAPIRLAAIEASFSVPCTIALSDGAERTEILSIVSCTSSDRTMQEYFAHVCETLLQIVGPSPSIEDVVNAMDRLVDLFQKLSSPAKRSAIGFFGELFVIDSASSPADAVAAWRSRMDDRFDFSVDNVRVEVKATSTRQRIHEFSLEQCMPPPGTDGVLISLFVEASGGGISLLELIDRIKENLIDDAELLLKFQETVAEALGESASTALTMRFDENHAKSSMQMYDLSVIPAIRASLPPEISRVRFRSDLSRAPTVDTRALTSLNATLKALLPR